MSKSAPQIIRFGDFALDPGAQTLLKGNQPRTLRAKSFAVLLHLLQHPGRVVTKDELLDSVWSDVAVSDDMPRLCVGELRKALGDDSRTPRFIETVHGKGYRFIASVRHPSPPPRTEPRSGIDPLIVGRDEELFELEQMLHAVVTGRRQTAWIVGEAGIGKSTLVDAFLTASSETKSDDDERVRFARGACREGIGSNDPFMPLLNIAEVLAEDAETEALLARHAPHWRAQLPKMGIPPLNTDAKPAEHASRARMLAEIAAFVEALSQQTPLILVIEDLHWSDSATIDALAEIVARRGPARLMILATLRGGDEAPTLGTKLALSLNAVGHVRQIDLTGLTSRSVAQYMERRFPDSLIDYEAAAEIHRQSGGNPLFFTTLVERIVDTDGARVATNSANGSTGESSPDHIDALIAQQMDRLTADELNVLQRASISGAEFSSQALAAAADDDPDGPSVIDPVCDRLAGRGRFLIRLGESRWPDGSVGTRYAFRHALYQAHLYDGLALETRALWHRRIGERLETGFANHTGDIASDLAFHFERGEDFDRASLYHEAVGHSAANRWADREAAGILDHALQLLARVAPAPDRAERELRLELARGAAVAGTVGYGGLQVETAYQRAQALAEQIGDRHALCASYLGLRLAAGVRGTLDRTRELSEQAATLADRISDPDLKRHAEAGLGVAKFYLGDLAQAREHLSNGLHASGGSDDHMSIPFGLDRRVECLAYTAWTLWVSGYAKSSLESANEALTLAQSIGHPATLAFALSCVSWLHLYRREPATAQKLADTAITVSTDADLDYLLGGARTLRGWALADQGKPRDGLEEAQLGAAAAAVDAQHVAASYSWIRTAAMCAELNQTEDALALGEIAHKELHRTRAAVFGPEVHRLQGRILSRAANTLAESGDPLRVERMFAKSEARLKHAAVLARNMGARPWELRALVDTCVAYRERGLSCADTLQQLRDTLERFPEEPATADVEDAEAVLASSTT